MARSVLGSTMLHEGQRWPLLLSSNCAVHVAGFLYLSVGENLEQSTCVLQDDREGARKGHFDWQFDGEGCAVCKERPQIAMMAPCNFCLTQCGETDDGKAASRMVRVKLITACPDEGRFECNAAHPAISE